MRKPIVVVDTSVMIVACISKRSNYSIDLLNMAFDGKITLVACKETLLELRDVFSRPKFSGLLDTKEARHLIKTYTEIVILDILKPKFLEKVKGYCTDPKDDIFLALADQVGADYLATLDSGDLLVLETWQQIRIVRPVTICKDLSEHA